jgi:transcriptional regulator with XRE-family HTH domain
MCPIGHQCIAYDRMMQRVFPYAEPTAVPEVARSVGARLRLLRTIHGLSLDELAQRTGLTKSYLSKVERGLSEPSLGSLLKLCQAYGITTGELLGEVPNPSPVQVVRKTGRTPLHKLERYPGYVYEAIAHARVDKAMLPFVMHPPLRSEVQDPDLVEHEGQELIFVLRGEIDFMVPGETIRLAAGDAVYFDASLPHRSVSVGRAPSEALVVISAASPPRPAPGKA